MHSLSIPAPSSYFLPALSPGEVITDDRLVHLDLYKIFLLKGQHLAVDVETAVNIAQVYLFNSDGQLLLKQAIADFQVESNQEFSLFKNPFAEITANFSQIYYIGICLLESKITTEATNRIFSIPQISPDQYILTLILSGENSAVRSLTPPPMHPGICSGDRLIFGIDSSALTPGHSQQDSLVGGTLICPGSR
jgi:hypothetical protein